MGAVVIMSGRRAAATRPRAEVPAKDGRQKGDADRPTEGGNEMPGRLMLTPEGRAKLRAELEHLRSVRRKEAVERLQAARELSDAWDSPEYIEAKNEMSFIEGRIMTLERMLADAGVIR